jgi:exosortase/archaeosortase family protein
VTAGAVPGARRGGHHRAARDRPLRTGGAARSRAARPAGSSPAATAARLAVGCGLIALAALVAHEDLKIRSFEAWLAGRVIAAGARVPTTAVPKLATVWFGIRTTRIGLVITPECTIALLMIPFLVATALIVWMRRRVTLPLAGLSAALVLLVGVNQVRLLGIVWFVKEMGFQSGYYWGHTLVGSMITIVGLAGSLATFAYLGVCRGRSTRT